MHPVSQNPGPIQAANQAQALACSGRQEKRALAFQAVSAVNMAVLTGVAAIHPLRDLRRAERRSVRSR
jgi:hypothetical protein